MLVCYMTEICGKRKQTSSSFSGRPFRPPLGICLSANHHPSVGSSIISSRSRIANAAVHTNTRMIYQEVVGNAERGADLVPHDSPRRSHCRIRHQSFYTAQCIGPFYPYPACRDVQVEKAPILRSTKIVCRSRQRSRPRTRQKAVEETGYLTGVIHIL
jgi:hypothetical protein